MVEDSKEIVLQSFDLGEATNIRLFNLQLRWGISIANTLKLDGMDRLNASFGWLEGYLISHDERKVTWVNQGLGSVARG